MKGCENSAEIRIHERLLLQPPIRLHWLSGLGNEAKAQANPLLWGDHPIARLTMPAHASWERDNTSAAPTREVRPICAASF